jgi:hypothetical protein
MTPIEQLRALIGDPDGTDFTPEILQFYLDNSKGNLNRTAAFIWGLKAINVLAKMQSISLSKMTVGTQTYEYRSLDADYTAALEMEKYFSEIANNASLGSIKISKLARPDIFTQLGGGFDAIS